MIAKGTFPKCGKHYMKVMTISCTYSFPYFKEKIVFAYPPNLLIISEQTYRRKKTESPAHL
jgi:hypothetical protein